ncbi:MAG: DUF2807 domain-containing protein [Bacteroidaceae bacterium]|nr:DUF2807 domain-containing protein [Bacteroidaceae bacterium]
MKQLLITHYTLFIIMFLCACSGHSPQGVSNKQEAKAAQEYRNSSKWGKATSKEIDTRDFRAIRTEGHVEIIYIQDSVYSVKAFGNEKAIEQYEFNRTEAGGLLEIKLKDYHYDEAGNFDEDIPGISVFITSPTLADVHIYGEGDVEIKKELRQQVGLNIWVDGKGDVDIKDIETALLNIEVNGKGDVKVKRAQCRGNAVFRLNGQGDVNAKLECANTQIEVNGQGDVKLKVKCNELTAICNGQGDITLSGQCNTLNKRDGAAAAINSRDLQVKKINLIK